MAIPTEKELKSILNNAVFSFLVNNGRAFLRISVFESNNGGKEYKGEISIPLIGTANYIVDNTGTPTKYTTSSGEIKQFGYGAYKTYTESQWNNNLHGVAPEGYEYVIVNKKSDGQISNIVCYQYGYEYSDVYLLTSDIPSTKKTGETYAHIAHIKINIISGDSPNIPGNEDVEFYGVEIDVEYEDARCSASTGVHRDKSFMILPVRYDGNFNIKVKGNLLINDKAFINYNQEYDRVKIPYLAFTNMGVPEINKGEFNYTFTNVMSSDFKLSTEFKVSDTFDSVLSMFKSSNITEIEGGLKLLSDVKEGFGSQGGYLDLKNNENLYRTRSEIPTYEVIIFDTRNLFDGTTSEIEITINYVYNEHYKIPDDTFVLPSIYKPFYIKRLYSIDYNDDVQGAGQYPYYDVTSFVGVYNGIGLFAQKGVNTSVVPNGSIGQINEIINTPMTPLPGYNNGGNSGGSLNVGMPENLIKRLNNYFEGDTTFSDNFGYFYDYTKDVYVIGLIEDDVIINPTQGNKYITINNTLPIFRDKPLILSDYNDSIYDDIYLFGNRIQSVPSYNQTQATKIGLNTVFTSVSEPYFNTQFNSNQEVDRVINFGNLFNKMTIYWADVIDGVSEGNFSFNRGKDTDKEEVVKILNNKYGIRYYLVNEVFYNNYVNISASFQTKEENVLPYIDEYLNNREYYDLNPHKVDFKNTDIWDDVVDPEFGYDPHDKIFYLPFFDMIPALKNTKGYGYSDGSEHPNYNVPIAIELYQLDQSAIADYYANIEHQIHDTRKRSQLMPLYLIGVYSPLTKLDGNCMGEPKDSPYVNQIVNNNEIIPQQNDTTIIYCYGCVSVHQNKT
jgi:hypothetical protein